MKLPNYVVEANPFHLAGPPDYWLRALWDFDPSLVVIPSRTGFYYRVGQRRPLKVSTALVNDILKEDADARMLASNGLVPVTTMLSTANWSEYPKHLEELRCRAAWRLGGAKKVSDGLDAADRQTEIDKQVKTDVALTDLSKDAWGLYLKKIGVRSHMWIPRTPSSVPTAAESPFKKSTPAPQILSTWVK